MTARSPGLFARRGISLPSAKVTVLAVILAFALGLVVGWGSSQLPHWLEARDNPTPSVTPSTEPSPEPDVSVPPLAPITRELTPEDEVAGLITLEYPYEADGVTTAVSGQTNPLREGAPVRHVSIEIEDGLEINQRTFAEYVMAILNDVRGWGAHNRLQYVRTDGAADFRIVLASPYTAARLCPDRHGVGTDFGGADIASLTVLGFSSEDGPTPSASPEAQPDEPEGTCASSGMMVLSLYDWAAGLESFETFEKSVVASRVYLVQHGMGHLLGEEDVPCTRGQAPVMTDHRELPEGCEANPWPFPDVPVSSDHDNDDDNDNA